MSSHFAATESLIIYKQMNKSTDMKQKDYTESIARSAVKKVGSLCRVRQFVRAWNIAATYGPLPLLFNLSSLV